MSQSLIIVESPSKARTIKKYLGKGYTVKASVGHIRDLPSSELGVEVEKDFQPKYVTIKGKEKIVSELQKAAKDADEIYLAPDPDREGEAIAWHIAKSLKVDEKAIKRVLFNEITKTGIAEGLKNTRPLDENLFASQQTRRILDRLVGYKLSPLLWKKVKRGLSAGRVQSVAMRLVVEREQQIEAFVPEEYWDIFADLVAEEPPDLRVKLTKKGDKKFKITNGDDAGKVVEALKNNPFKVEDIRKKPISRKASPPFITSTLQQTASSQLRMVPRRTMQIAQQLYEGVQLGGEGPVGLITYMRTDSFRVSAEAVQACREYIQSTHGKEYLPDKPNAYRSKKSAQDAHEAIRPTSMEFAPGKIKEYLSNEQFRLYRTVWNRFIASQMLPARYEQTAVDVRCDEYLLIANHRVEVFPGYLAAYRNGEDNKVQDNDEGVQVDQLPPLNVGQQLNLKTLDPQQKFTLPPARFSESTLIRELEEKGIGRPSTYATITTVIQDKEYVAKISGTLRPTDLGRTVTRLLIENFPEVMKVTFTALMEDNLDKIEEGKDDPLQLLKSFWEEFSKKLESAADHMKNIKQTGEPTDQTCDKCKSPLVIKYGRNGPFLTCTDDKCKTIYNFARDDENKIVIVRDEESDEVCEKCGSPMVKKHGRFGPYLACSGYPKCKNTISLDKNGKKKTTKKIKPDPNVLCELCESPMILRTSRYGNRFYSCSKYPKCKGTRSFQTDISCPKEGCTGKLVEQLSRKKPRRVFWGCTEYPECDFVVNETPINQACPNCNHKIMTKKPKTDLVHCPGCGHELEGKVKKDKS